MSVFRTEGSLLFTEKPFVCVLHYNQRLKRCDHCFEEKKLTNCRLCDKIAYCSSQCEEKGWPMHKFECPNMKRISPKIVPESVGMMARIIYKLKYCKGLAVKGFYGEKENEYRTFGNLQSHYEELQQDRKRLEDFLSLTHILEDFMGHTEVLPPPTELLTIYGKMLINSFNIMDPNMNTIGSGLYLGASRFDHSCVPNAVATFSGTTISIRLIKPVSPFDWSKVFVSYIDVLQPTSKRISELKKGYFFECQCVFCLDREQQEHMLSMSCPNQKCSEPIYISEEYSSDVSIVQLDIIKCRKCGEEVTQTRLESYLSALEFIEAQLDRMKHTSYLDVCQISLRKQEGLFHEYNIYKLQILDCAFSSAIDLAHWREAKEYGERLLVGQRKYYGEIHPILGHTLLKVAKIMLLDELDDACIRDKVRCYVENGAKIIRICFGEEHRLFKEHVRSLLDSVCTFDLNISPVYSRKKKVHITEPPTTTLRTTQTAGLEQFEGKKSVLFLCRDNYMRSPMIKSLFKEMLAMANQTNEWIVESAGIGWWDVGKGMDPRAKERCEMYGLDTEHVVREITKDDFYKFDYIIATDETDLSFLRLEAPPDSSAQLVKLGTFTRKAKFQGPSDLPDPFFLKTKELINALDDIIHRGYWYLRGFLDTLGIEVPETTTLKIVTVRTSPKIKSSTWNAWRLEMSSLQALVSRTKFKDRITVKSTHRKLQ